MASHKGSPALPLSPDPWMAETVWLSMAKLVPTPESPSEQKLTAADPMTRLPLAGGDLQVVGQKRCGGQWGHIASFVSRSHCTDLDIQPLLSFPPHSGLFPLCVSPSGEMLWWHQLPQTRATWAATRPHTSSAWWAGIGLNNSKLLFYFNCKKKCGKHPSNYPSLAY